jgi:hypothetical protein
MKMKRMEEDGRRREEEVVRGGGKGCKRKEEQQQTMKEDEKYASTKRPHSSTAAQHHSSTAQQHSSTAAQQHNSLFPVYFPPPTLTPGSHTVSAVFVHAAFTPPAIHVIHAAQGVVLNAACHVVPERPRRKRVVD